MPVEEGELLWRGSDSFVSASNVVAFMRWLEGRGHGSFSDYESLRLWSIADVDLFWRAVWDYFGVASDQPFTRALGGRVMPDAVWFEGARLNFAEHILRHERTTPDANVLLHASETRPLTALTWQELGDQVRALASALRARGIEPGDRVAAYLPNIAEAVVAMLAVASVGAVWSSAAPEFGVQTVVERFSQIAPKLLFATDGYRYGGRDFDRREHVVEIAAETPSIETIVWINCLGLGRASVEGVRSEQWQSLLGANPQPRESFTFERVPHDHPLWVLFSSGTTGLPKAIVHSHVGILLEYYKMGAFHLNLTPRSVLFFYSTTGWMMWNLLMQAPLLGGAVLLFDGNPAYPDPMALWRLASDAKATVFGASPAYIELMRKHGVSPKDAVDVSSIDTVLLSGAPATPETFAWFYENVSADLWVTSQSGGTEFCSAILVASPTEPVHAGEIQVRALGADIRVLDDAGAELADEVGELVLAQPMPSMPLSLWGDDTRQRYRDAYFDTYPGLWRHGDFIRINKRGGAYIYGRSDATLNRHGVRIGSAEIYRTIEALDDVADSLVVCIEEQDGGHFMPLFVKLRVGLELDDDMTQLIKQRLKSERSPRHVPDIIVAAPHIPYTLSGKRMEIPVRKLLMGWPVEKSFSSDAMKDPTAMDWYIDYARSRTVQTGRKTA